MQLTFRVEVLKGEQNERARLGMWGVLGLPTLLATWNAGKLPLPLLGVALQTICEVK